MRNLWLHQIVPQSPAPGYPRGTLVHKRAGMEGFVDEREQADAGAAGAEVAKAQVLRTEVLGVAALGERATLVQFSSAFCQPCRATRRTLADVSAMVEGVAHVEIDAEEHLSLVRELEITATPTVLVLDAAGRVVTRASGLPRRADVIAALGTAVG